MVDREKLLSTLDSLNEMSKDVDFGTFANLALYTLIVLSQAVEGMPPAVVEQIRAGVYTVVDEATRSVSPADNRHAMEMLRRLGLLEEPGHRDHLWHVAFARN